MLRQQNAEMKEQMDRQRQDNERQQEQMSRLMETLQSLSAQPKHKDKR